MNAPRFLRGALLLPLVALISTACAAPSAMSVPDALPIRVGPVEAATLAASLEDVPRDPVERASRLLELFHAEGCRGEHVVVRPDSLRCTLYGESDSVVVVAANFDAPVRGDGLVDNWTGVALLPALYGALKTEPRKHTYVFAAFSGTTRGQKGARRFLREIGDENVARVHAMVNLKGLGLDTPAVWRSEADPELRLDLVSVSRATGVPLRAIDFTTNVATDAKAFQNRHIPTVTIHSFDRESTRILENRTLDRLEIIDMDAYHATARMLSFYLAYLDRTISLRISRRQGDAPPVATRPTEPAPGDALSGPEVTGLEAAGIPAAPDPAAGW